MNYNNDLEYNEDIKVLKYPQGPYFWSVCFSVTIEEDGRIVNCLISREVVEDHFYDDLKEFDVRAIAKIEELMEEEILPILLKAIKNNRINKQDRSKGIYLEVELNVDDFFGKDFRK